MNISIWENRAFNDNFFHMSNFTTTPSLLLLLLYYHHHNPHNRRHHHHVVFFLPDFSLIRFLSLSFHFNILTEFLYGKLLM